MLRIASFYFITKAKIIRRLGNNKRPRKYWSDLKQKLISEGFVEVSEKIGQLKMLEKDGKIRTSNNEFGRGYGK